MDYTESNTQTTRAQLSVKEKDFSIPGTNRAFALQPSSQAAFLIKVVTYPKEESRKYLDLFFLLSILCPRQEDNEPVTST